MVSILLLRIGQSAISLLGISFVVFASVFLIGEPASLYDPLVREDPARLAALRSELGLDQPLYIQYINFLRDVMTGKFGTSWVYQEPAMQVILERLPATLELVALAIAIAFCIGYPLGLLSGWKKPSALSASIERISVLGYSAPTFWVGLVLIYIFAVGANALPSIGRGGTAQVFGIQLSLFTADGISHLILPALTLSLYEIGYFTRMISTMTEETKHKTFISFAHAKGLPVSRVISNHLLKAISAPLVTIVAIETGALIAGSVITETVFAWPGVGKLLVDSVAALDRPVIVAFVLLTAIAFLVLNLVADLVQMLMDPTLRPKGVPA
ncbi:MAG: ABC transporter permease [Pseudomonadota bacterium]